MAEKQKPNGELEEDLDDGTNPLEGHEATVNIEEDGGKNPLDGDFEDHISAQEDETPPEEDPYAALEAQFKQLQSERDRVAAERDAERARAAELERSQGDAQISELQNHKLLVEHAYAATQTDVEEAKRAYREARANGDIEAELAATEALSDARDKLRQLVAGHQEIERRLANPPRPAPPQKQAAPAADEIERTIVENFPNPRDQAWLRAHRDDIFGDVKRQEFAAAVDRMARLKGLEPQSDEYYAYLDREMGYEAEPKPAKQPIARQPATPPPAQERRKPLPGAPVSRSNGARSEAVERASPAIKRLASDLGMSVSEYMENDRLIREGKTHHRYS